VSWIPSDRRVSLGVGDVEVTVDLDAGARATAWTVRGEPLLTGQGSDPVEYGMYPMAPWAGRIRGNNVPWCGHDHPLPVTYREWAIHGTALAQSATVIDLEQGSEVARLVARIEEHPGWPWPMAIDVGWEVRDGEVATTITVHALAEPFPAVVGWHPWFRRELGSGDPLQWTVDATERLERGVDQLPTGRRMPYDPNGGPFDDAFVVPSGRARLRWPGVLAIDVTSDGDWFVVYDELRQAVCVEPQSGPPDGLSGATIAAPGSPHVLNTTWMISDDPPAGRA
jgi:aldose 1-epimerase